MGEANKLSVIGGGGTAGEEGDGWDGGMLPFCNKSLFIAILLWLF